MVDQVSVLREIEESFIRPKDIRDERIRPIVAEIYAAAERGEIARVSLVNIAADVGIDSDFAFLNKIFEEAIGCKYVDFRERVINFYDDHPRIFGKAASTLRCLSKKNITYPQFFTTDNLSKLMSVTDASKPFKKATGLTYNQYVAARRIKHIFDLAARDKSIVNFHRAYLTNCCNQ